MITSIEIKIEKKIDIMKEIQNRLQPDQWFDLLQIRDSQTYSVLESIIVEKHHRPNEEFLAFFMHIKNSLAHDQWLQLVMQANNANQTALAAAAIMGHTDVVKEICQSVSKNLLQDLLTKIDMNNRNVLHYAAYEGKEMIETIKAFVTDSDWDDLLAAPLPEFHHLVQSQNDPVKFEAMLKLLHTYRIDAEVGRVSRLENEEGK